MRVQNTWLLSIFSTQTLFGILEKVQLYEHYLRNITALLWSEKENTFCSGFYFFICVLGVGPFGATVFLEM